MKRKLIIAGSILGLLVLLCGVFIFIGYRNFMTVEAVEYDPELEILIGGGGNSIILTAEDGFKALVVDTKMGGAAKQMSRRLNSKIRQITIVNTHFHADHIGGNALYPGAKLIAGEYPKEQWAAMTKNSRYPDRTVKPGEEEVMTVGSETVHIRNMGNAHTTNDCVVYLEKRKLLVTGDIIFLNRHPVLFAQNGCNVALWINVLDTLYNRYEIRTLVPGHGGVSDKNALLTMKEYFASIRGAIGDERKLAALRVKYRKYTSFPGMSGFDKTVEFIKNEK